MTFTVENNAMRLQWRLSGQQGPCSGGMAGVSSRGLTDRHTHTQTLSVTISSPLTQVVAKVIKNTK